jgi:ribosome-associated protein YbcJ (S4-like RNA binding protein)
MKKWVDANYSGSKAKKIIILKVHINGKISTRMEKMLRINV